MARSSTLSPEQVSKFDSDGVILLRNAVSADWIDLLARGLDRNIATPPRDIGSGIATHRGEPAFMTARHGK